MNNDMIIDIMWHRARNDTRNPGNTYQPGREELFIAYF